MNNNVITPFQFKSRELPLDVAGVKFVIDLSKEGSPDKLIEVGTNAVNRAKELRSIPNTGRTNEQKALHALKIIKQANEFTMSAIDEILGEGACNIIFDGRVVDFFDALDVLGYVINSVKQANANRIAERSGQYTNRAQKRAVTKNKKS